MTPDIHVVRRALVIGVIGCLGVFWAAGQEKPHTAAPSAAAKNDVRAEIDAHAAQWLKDSDVPSFAMAYIEEGKVAWTAVYGEQSREVCGQRNARRRIDEGDCSGTSHDDARSGEAGRFGESMQGGRGDRTLHRHGRNGIGMDVETVNGEKILNHDGSDWGVKTFAMFVPSQGIGVVMFTNGENGNAVIKKVVQVLYLNKLYVATM